MSTQINYTPGTKGVNVDVDNFNMDDSELRLAQNAIKDPLGNAGGISARPGLTKFNGVAASGMILGGVGVPLLNLVTGSRFVYIGRGPVS